jgi:hypothetical protein
MAVTVSKKGAYEERKYDRDSGARLINELGKTSIAKPV